MGKENMMGARLWFIWPVLIADWWRLNATHASWEAMYRKALWQSHERFQEIFR
jgi:hypothetical protein